MHCELCGKEILEKPKRVMIEGAQLETCAACGSLGTEIRRPQTLRGPTNKVAAHSRTRTGIFIAKWRVNLIPISITS